MSIKILYFAWVREKVGKADEIVDLPPGATTVADVIAWLRERGPEYRETFASTGVVRAAIDRVHVQPAASVAGAREIAFFPPVTGG
jgi:molybdopterin synthase sulfur carrier subunit